MKSLQELSIKSICKNVTSASEFLIESPLPWSLTQNIVTKYSKYKWGHINKITLNDTSRYLKCMKFVHCNSSVSLSLRNAILAREDWDDLFENNRYCLWVKNYIIRKYKMLVCNC